MGLIRDGFEKQNIQNTLLSVFTPIMKTFFVFNFRPGRIFQFSSLIITLIEIDFISRAEHSPAQQPFFPLPHGLKKLKILFPWAPEINIKCQCDRKLYIQSFGCRWRGIDKEVRNQFYGLLPVTITALALGSIPDLFNVSRRPAETHNSKWVLHTLCLNCARGGW